MMDKLFLDALKFLHEKGNFQIKDFSKRSFLKKVIKNQCSPKEQERLLSELRSLTDGELECQERML